MMATQDILTEALSEAMETMAFLATGPVDDQAVFPETPVLVEIRFSGARTGSIQILSSQALGRVLAENIGCLDRADEQASLDAWKEVCNVTCGLVIPRIAASPADVFDLTVPAVSCGEGVPAWNDFVAQGDTRTLSVDGHATAARLVIQS